MSNIKVIRLGQTLDWDHSFNCSLKKYSGVDGLVDFSEYIKIFFENKKLLNKYHIKFSHCRMRHKGNFIVVDIYLQDLDFINKIVKNNSVRRLVLRRKRRKIYRFFGNKNVESNLKIIRILKKLVYRNLLFKRLKLKNFKLKDNISEKLFCNNKLLGVTNKKRKAINVFCLEISNIVKQQSLQLKKIKGNKNVKLKRYQKLRYYYFNYIRKSINKFQKKINRFSRINFIYNVKKYYKKKKCSIFTYKKKVASFLKERSHIYKQYKKFLRRFKFYKKNDLNMLLNKRIGSKFIKFKVNKKFRVLRYYNKLQMLKYLDIEKYLAKAGYKFFKKNVLFNYCILDNYIITSNIIVKYICERLKQGFFIGEILKDVEFVLANSKDVLGFCIDCIGRFGRKRRTSFKRLSIRKLLKTKINAVMDCSMDFVILRYGCCNVKVLLNKRENYREYRYKFRVY